jgi:hypothetical protein
MKPWDLERLTSDDVELRLMWIKEYLRAEREQAKSFEAEG